VTSSAAALIAAVTSFAAASVVSQAFSFTA